MGFFTPKVTCAVCGREVGYFRYSQGKTINGEHIWVCASCIRRYGDRPVSIDRVTGKVSMPSAKDTEVKMKCNTCGSVYCFNAEDLIRNRRLAKEAVQSSLLGIGEAVAGTRIGSQIATNTASEKLNQIVDYTRCPKCNSADVEFISDEELKKEKEKSQEADEVLIRYKNLLDHGIISQEEFDAKKKQLLGL